MPNGEEGMPLTEYERRQALGKWGEQKTLILLKDAQFSNGRDINLETHNHPFGDVYAEEGPGRFVLGVKTRNMYQQCGLLNASINVSKKGFDIGAIGKRYNAILAWMAFQVIPELQTFNAYFGTIDQIQQHKTRFSIPMKPEEIRAYKYRCFAAN